MRIAFDKFDGIIPGTAPHKLPDSAAQIAHNVDLSGTTLKPMQTVNDFTRLHDDNGDMVAGVNADDLTIIPKAPTITKDDLEDMVGAQITLYFKAEQRLPNGTLVDTSTGSVNLTLKRTSYGLTANFSCPCSFSGSLGVDDTYIFKGPYITGISVTPAYGDGYTINDLGGLPQIAVPLYAYLNSNTTELYQYGTLTISNCTLDGNALYTWSGLKYDDEGALLSGSWSKSFDHIGANIDFACNFIQSSPQKYYYIQQYVDDYDRDGPESDVSAPIIVPPGYRLALALNAGTTYKKRIFRSYNSGSDYVKLTEVTAATTTFTDYFTGALTDPLLPNGNVPFDTVEEAVKGAVSHPAGYSVYYKDNELRPSSEWYERARPWTCPEEYAHAFDSNIQCIALVGGTILVFTENAVFTASGQHPGRLAVYQISNKPILNKLSLWKIGGGMVGWINEEGLAVYNGNDAQLLTGDYMRADQWNNFDIANFQARVNDRSICLFSDTCDELRFDLRGDRKAAISTFDTYDGTGTLIWKSKPFNLKKQSTWYAVRIDAEDYPVNVRFFADGAEAGVVQVLDERACLLPRMAKGRIWEFQIESKVEVNSVSIASNMREL